MKYIFSTKRITSINLKVIWELIRLNVGWLSTIMRDTLTRYKILTVLVVTLLSSSLKSVYAIISWPVINIVSDSATLGGIACSVACFNLLGLVWIYLYKQVLHQQPWEKYLFSLPFSIFDRMLSEINILLVSNFFIIVPVIVAATVNIFAVHGAFNIAIIIGKSLFIVLSVIFLQIVVIRKKYPLLFSAFLIDIIFCLQNFLLEPRFKLSVIIFLVLSLFANCINCYKEPANKARGNKRNKKHICTANKINYFNFLTYPKIQAKNLFVHNISELTMNLVAIGLIIVFYAILIAYIKDPKINILATTITMLLSALILSNTFPRLQMQRNKFNAFISALPLSRMKIFGIDFMVVGCNLFFANLIILILAMCFDSERNALRQVVEFAFSYVLLATVYLPQIKLIRHGFVLSLVIMCIFSFVEYYLLNL